MLLLGELGPKEVAMIANVRRFLAAVPAAERMTNMDMPIACALNQAQFAERKRLVERLAQEATERRRLPNGVGTELAKFVDLERDCCPFLTFRIDAQPGEPVGWNSLARLLPRRSSGN
jgi:hypothetical protein